MTRWARANRNHYRSRVTCQRACDWMNRQLGSSLWHEPVMSEDGSHFEMWVALRCEAWEDDPDEPEAGLRHPPGPEWAEGS